MLVNRKGAPHASDVEKQFLKSAYQNLINDIIPTEEEESAIVKYIDKFVTCSLKDPMSADIAKEVNCHKHSHTCRRAGGVCPGSELPLIFGILTKM